MSIKVHLEQVIKNLEAEREHETNIIKEKVMREIVSPFNRDMDVSRDKAIAELQQKLNNSISALQEQFAKDRQAIIEANEKKKADNATAVITTESYSVTVQYDKAIAKIKEQIEELK
jgi:hypothetical protein